MSIELNYAITKDELIKFHLNHITKSKFYEFKCVIIFQTSIFLSFLIILGTFREAAVPYLSTALIMILFFKKTVLFALFKYLFNRKYSSEPYDLLFKTTTSIFSNSKIICVNYISQTTFSIESITGVFIVDNYIYLQMQSHEELLIPIDTLETVISLRSFKDYINENTSLEIKYTYPKNIKYF